MKENDLDYLFSNGELKAEGLKMDGDTLTISNLDVLCNCRYYISFLLAGVKRLKLNFIKTCGMTQLMSALAIEQFKDIEYIDVCEENEDFVSVDGLVYSKNGKYLIYCPRGKEGIIKIKEGTQIIFNSAFFRSRVSEVSFPTSLRELKSHAFSQCQNLISVRLNDEMEIIGSFTFHACENLEDVYLGKSLKSIRDYAFGKNAKLCNIDIPKTVTTIGDAAFIGCPLENVMIPSSVRKIGKCAFTDTLKLKACSYDKALLNACVGPYYLLMPKDNAAKTMTLQIGEHQEIVLPKHSTENDMAKINKCIRKFLKSGAISDLAEIYKYAGNNEEKVFTAIKISETYDSAPTAKRYLTKMAEKIVESVQDENALVDMVSGGGFSYTALKKMLNASQKKGYTIANAYILEKLNDSSKSKTNLHI